ncbi:hypothetical protein [Morganella morganii]|uniref:hypothetical protein n=1 Tax=Morganella morganii TaxID=582 RepID=UPI0032DB1114
MTDKTGGSAFPLPATEWNGADEGMTLRDYFAAKAMCGDWASQNEGSGYFAGRRDDNSLNKAAEMYYLMADAMLIAREK